MKFILAAILFIAYKESFTQSANWETGKETYVVNYELEKSTDNIIFVKVIPIEPARNDTNYYSYKLIEQAWYRIKANMVSGVYYTDSKYSKVTNQPPKVYITVPNQTIKLKK